MQKVDLVFRTIGERTSQASLDLAIRNIQPNQVHIIENIKPFSQAVQHMLRLNYDCDFIVFMDADCLILEEMFNFLQKNTEPYVDCYVLDKFRGQIHCGVHITRIDVVQSMQTLNIPNDDPKYVLRPESRLRALAIKQLGLGKVFKQFNILHDFFQFYRDIFCKYALRDLRSRTAYHQAKLDVNQEDWDLQGEDWDFKVAKYAIAHTRNTLKPTASSSEIAKFIEDLPKIAVRELNNLAIPEKGEFTLEEAWDFLGSLESKKRPRSKKMKVFGIGLGRTGTKSLTLALNRLGINVVHYPNDETTLNELIAGNYDFSILAEFDGITDITVAPFYAQLDQLFPDTKFILTVRDKESWLRSLEKHWSRKLVFEDSPGSETKMQLRRLLRMAVYGTCTFNAERLSYVYDLHYKNVTEYFKNRPESLLVLNICAGEGWEKLCPFFKQPILDEPFLAMNRKSVLTNRLSG